MMIPPDVVTFSFLHQGVFCLLSVFTGPVHHSGGGYFSFGHSPNHTGWAQVRFILACQPFTNYLLPVSGSSLRTPLTLTDSLPCCDLVQSSTTSFLSTSGSPTRCARMYALRQPKTHRASARVFGTERKKRKRNAARNQRFLDLLLRCPKKSSGLR